MSKDRFRDVLAQVEYPDTYFIIQVVDHDYDPIYYMQVECESEDSRTGDLIRWKARKWILSPRMTDGEIVQTAWLAVMTAIEHEAREQFTYKGQTVFDPHFDIEKLAELRAQPGALKERA